MSVKPKITELLKRLNDGVFDKDEVIALSLLSAVAGESIFLLGAPGVAKSLVARRLKFAFKDGSSFEYLMSRFSTPDEIFGPVSISQLKDNDKYERIVKNYLPTATVVFLDEIWKAGPSIQNALLTVLNEKIYRNGEQEIKIPMKALLSASNELPAKGEGLEALWDRFLVRYIVDGVKSNESFKNMISKNLNSYSDTVVDLLKISNDEVKNWNRTIDEIEIPENVFNVILMIRSYIEQHNQIEENKGMPIYISDRRWRKIARLLRTSAFLNDRKNVDLMDCFLIRHCLWDDAHQIQATYQFVADAIQLHGYSLHMNFQDLRRELDEFKAEIQEETKVIKDTRAKRLLENNNFHELEKSRGQNKYLSIDDYNRLSNQDMTIRLYSHPNLGYHNHTAYNIKKGKEDYTISIYNEEYKLLTIEDGEKRITTRKPHKKLEEFWDSRIEQYLENTKAKKDDLEGFRNTDLTHLRVNLFVDPELATIVESQLNSTKREIEKFELEIRKIQNDYKNLKDE